MPQRKLPTEIIIAGYTLVCQEGTDDPYWGLLSKPSVIGIIETIIDYNENDNLEQWKTPVQIARHLNLKDISGELRILYAIGLLYIQQAKKTKPYYHLNQDRWDELKHRYAGLS